MPNIRQLLRLRRTPLTAIMLAVGVVTVGSSALLSAQAAPPLAAPTITSSPSAVITSTSRTATFAYSSPTTVNFRCALDSTTAYVACPAAAAKTGSITYTGLADGTHVFRVLAQSGTQQSSPTTFTWVIEATRPTVNSIVRLDQNPHAFGTVRWLVTFSEPVLNVSLANFAYAATGLGSGPALLSITPTSGTSATYTVSATSGPGTSSSNPTLRLDLWNLGTIRDPAGNFLVGPFTGETYNFDGAAPAVTLTKVNGTTVSFPFTTIVTANTVGGSCGTAVGDLPTVTVTISGPVVRTDTVTCSSGAWVDTVALSANGTYTVTATQPDSSGNTGTSGTKTLVVNRPDTTPPVVTLTKVNNSTVVNGDTIVFPLTTNVQINSIGGTCGTAAGDLTSVNVSIVGPTASLNRSGTATCSAGAWTFTVSPAFRNSPAGIDDGNYTITVTQADTAANVGTTGPKVLTLATRTFTVTGNAVTPLRPGTVSELNLTVNNPYPFALTVEAITVTFVGTSTCNGPANFMVSRAFTGPVTVASGNTTLGPLVAPQIKMNNLTTVQDGCKSASITLNYSGMASRA